MNKSIISRTGMHGFLFLTTLVAMLVTVNMKTVYAKEKQPYLIKVNRACNTVTVYEKDSKGNYTVPIKAMVCSVGTGSRTLTGTFNTKEKYRWKLLNGNVWGQYATRIVGGILFHSVYYYGYCDPSTLSTKEYNKLGTAASQGCIRLTVADAKWIYDNCPIGTQVIIYDDKKNPGPLGKPEAIKLPSNVKWDPTDPNEKNPYLTKQPKITGAKNISINYGETVDLLAGIKAVSSLGDDITSKLVVEGEIDYNTPGKYKITYSVTDSLKRECKKTVTITVKAPVLPAKSMPESEPENVSEAKPEYMPELKGVADRVVNSELTGELALSYVEAYYGNKAIGKDNIDVQMIAISNNEFKIIYKLSYEGRTVEKEALFIVDTEAPVIEGVRDFKMEAGEMPSDGYLLKNIRVSDNYTAAEKIRLSAEIIEDNDGGYLVIYKAEDEAGNMAKEEARIIV